MAACPPQNGVRVCFWGFLDLEGRSFSQGSGFEVSGLGAARLSKVAVLLGDPDPRAQTFDFEIRAPILGPESQTSKATWPNPKP